MCRGGCTGPGLQRRGVRSASPPRAALKDDYQTHQSRVPAADIRGVGAVLKNHLLHQHGPQGERGLCAGGALRLVADELHQLN